MADGQNFTISVPFYNGKMTRLSSLFLAVVDGKKISDRFSIENYRDFEPNIYAFSLPDRRVSVLDFGAVGNACHNDTQAIQNAIDYTSAQGGGTVVVPGDNTRYGKRYVVTTVRLKDNVELHLEKGAMLWQSPRPEEYTYVPIYGHDTDVPGINWTHTALCYNYPLIYARDADNIKLTGEGTVRLVDTGSDNLDGVGGTLWVGCESRIHLIPIAFETCNHVEISDITIERSNCYHLSVKHVQNACLQNITMHEVTCASGDGFSVGVKHGLINRCFLYSNDDAITLSSSYFDPRGLVWWESTPGADNCVEDIRIVHNNLYGGHGVTFIPWGTQAPDTSKQEIKGITVTDCVLGGNSAGIGTWPDNPYYGKQPFDNSETNDFSPIKDVYIACNRYTNVVDLACLRITNLWSDCGLYSTSTFENAGFERQNGQSGWVSGLSNWSQEAKERGSAEFVTASGGHAAKLTGPIFFYQGLYREAGNHAFSIDISSLSGSVQLVAVDAVSGKTIGIVSVTSAGRKTLTFKNSAARLLKLGVRLTDDSSTVTVDNASVSKTGSFPYPTYFWEDFEEGDTAIDTHRWVITQEADNRLIQAPSGNQGVFKLMTSNSYQDFDAEFLFRIDEVYSGVDGNIGFNVHQQGSDHVFLEYNTVSAYWRFRLFVGSSETQFGYLTGHPLTRGEWHRFGVRAVGRQYAVFVDGEELYTFSISSSRSGIIGVCTYNTRVSIDDFHVAEAYGLYLSQNPSYWFKEWFGASFVNLTYKDNWTVSQEDGNGILKTLGGTGRVDYVVAPCAYRDMDAKVRFRIDSLLSSVDANIGFGTHYRSSDEHLFIEYNPVGHYVLARQYIGGQEVRLQSVSNVDLSLNTWHTMGLHFVGDDADLFIDEAKVMTFKAVSVPTGGAFRISTYHVGISLDYVSVMPPYTIAQEGRVQAPYAETTVSEQNGALYLHTVLRGDTGTGARCMTAAYDQEGRLIEATAGQGGTSFDAVLPTGADTAAVFVWETMALTPKTSKEILPPRENAQTQR